MNVIERAEKEKQEKRALYAPLGEEPLDLDSIFQVMISALHEDYAGYAQKKRYFTPTEYRTYILSAYRFNKLTVNMLVRSLHQFTADMRDRHLTFDCTDWIDYRNTEVCFRVRAQKDCLWVTEAAEETGLIPGDKILRIQHQTPEHIRHYMRYHSFYSSEPERELWGGYLSMAEHAEVEHTDGRTETVTLKQFPRTDKSADTGLAEKYPITFSMPDAQTVCLRVERMDREAMESLLEEHGAEITGSRKLIIDLRRCIGGDEDACWDLFPYMLQKETTLQELLNDRGSYVNCSKTNCELRYRILSAYEKTLTDPEEIALIQEEEQFYLKHYGQGLCFKESIQDETVKILPVQQAPEHVILLTDTFCENEGEQFAAMCRRCGSKVTVIGRPTMGTLDFFDNVKVEINEHMTLSYPIAMSVDAYEGHGVAEKGLPVDEYIPWTPEEIVRDVIFERAVKLYNE